MRAQVLTRVDSDVQESTQSRPPAVTVRVDGRSVPMKGLLAVKASECPYTT